MAFTITKVGDKNFTHFDGFKEMNFSNWEIVLNNTDNTLILQMRNGAPFPKKEVLASHVIIKNGVDGAPESFGTTELIRERLVELGYNPFVNGFFSVWGDIGGNILNQTDLIDALDNKQDVPKQPLYLDLSLHAKTNGFAEAQKVITDVVRIDDFTLEVDPTEIEDFDDADLFFPLVVKTPTNYVVVTGVVTDKPNGIISTRQVLPTTIEEISTFFVDGQHLSRYGYRSLAEYIAEAIQKYSYRKDISFKVYADNCKPFEQNWIDSTTDEVLVTATKVPGTPSGGFLIPGELPFQCEMGSNSSADQSGTFFKKSYSLYQNVVGYGVVFSGFKNDSEGFCKIVVGEYLPYNEGALKIECKDQNDDVFFTQNVTGTTQEVIVPLAYQTTDFTISFTVVTAVVTAWKISLIELHRSYESAISDIINKDCTVSFLCDSWGSFPQAIGGETLPLRADGTEADGMQFLSVHLKDYLLTKGINTTIYNNSFGGRTSAWARYWLPRLVLNLPTKPDYCVIDFLINDANSESFAIANTDSVYDFSPTDPYTLQVKSAGGVKGSVTREQWQENMSYIIQTLLDNDIQPIVLHNHRLDGMNFTMIEYNTLMLNSAQGDLTNLVTGSSLDFVPLSGTPSDKPITGDIKIKAKSIIFTNASEDETFRIGYNLDEEFSELKIPDGKQFLITNESSQPIGTFTNGDIAFLGKTSVTSSDTDESGLRIGNNGGLGINRGIISDIDFSPNITDLDYTQKIYVDTKIPKDNGTTYDTNFIKTVTQSEYDAITTPDATTLYFIV